MFELVATDGAARRGRLTTAHGVIETPVFMPCGTYGTVKAMTPKTLEEVGTQILLGNTFHLLLRPGDLVIRDLGGLHGFMHWPHPILTDSGGFQVWSLGDLREISEDGVRFRSPIDGDRVELTPERSMQVQQNLGADILMVKPGMPYLDVLAGLTEAIPLPWAVYEVSGEYAAIEALAAQGLVNAPRAHVEAWLGFVRAGASIIISYGARSAQQWITDYNQQS